MYFFFTSVYKILILQVMKIFGVGIKLLILCPIIFVSHLTVENYCILPFKRQTKMAADDIFSFCFYLSKKIRPGFSCISSV